MFVLVQTIMCCSFSVIQGARVEIPTDVSNFTPQKIETWHAYLEKPKGVHLWLFLFSFFTFDPFFLRATIKEFTYKRYFCAELCGTQDGGDNSRV
jgi:hypothetical protein